MIWPPHRHAPLFAAFIVAAGLAVPTSGHTQEPACEAGQSLGEGACLAAVGTFDALAVVRGGVRRGEAATGQLRLALALDLEALAGLEGWRAQASGFAIAGRQLTATRLGSLAPASNIEATPTVRLFELWLERRVEGVGSLRFGQLAADAEFAGADAASALVNATFGWPVALATALPSGGTAYPLAAPGIRLALGDPAAASGVRLALFSGDPGGRYGVATDPQRHNRHGINFSTTGGAFLIAEAVTGGTAETGPRPWVVKLGGWYHTGGFNAQRPDAEGNTRRYGNNQGGYAVGEVTLLREGAQTLALFARGFAQPGSRNLVSLQLDAGLAWRGLFGRDDDTLSLGVSQARIGRQARAADRDRAAADEARPTRNRETVFEVNYDAAIVPGQLALRPVAQWIINPGAGEPDERAAAGQRLRNALVVGTRLVATY